jgi:hypothetical protein
MQLPLSVIKAVEEKFGDAEKSEIMEMTKEAVTTYYLQAEDKNKKYFLEVSPSGSISVLKRIKK